MSRSGPYRFLPPDLAETLRAFTVTVRRPALGSQQGQHRSPHFGASVEFAEYRAYAAGDPINLIDWAVYARSDRHVVRRYQEETNLRAHVLLDASGSLGFRDGGTLSKLEYACHLAAGVMFVLVNQGDAAGLTVFDRRVRRTFAPAASFEGLRPLLLALEDVKASGPGDIEACLHEAAAQLRARSLVVLISDLLQDPAALSRGLRHLHHDGHNVLVLHVLDPAERRLAFAGLTELRDLETGERMTVDAEELRDAYAHGVETFIAELRTTCAECLADYHLMDTRTPVDEALTHLRRKAAG